MRVRLEPPPFLRAAWVDATNSSCGLYRASFTSGVLKRWMLGSCQACVPFVSKGNRSTDARDVVSPSEFAHVKRHRKPHTEQTSNLCSCSSACWQRHKRETCEIKEGGSPLTTNRMSERPPIPSPRYEFSQCSSLGFISGIGLKVLKLTKRADI